MIIFIAIEECTKADKASFHDFSGLEVIPENDTHTFINGTWKFLKRIESPWPMHVYTEHYIRGEWLVQAFDSFHYKDFCQSIKNPAEPWYYAFKGFKGCPIPEGVSFKRNYFCKKIKYCQNSF